MQKTGTNSRAPELALMLDRNAGAPLHVQLESALREAIRTGRLASGTRLPPSRTLAGDVGVSRRLVVEAYAQLLAEGYLRSRRGAGTFVAEAAEASGAAAEPVAAPALAFDFFPGSPDLAGFPARRGCAPRARRCAWRPTRAWATRIRAALPSCAVPSPATCAAFVVSWPAPTRSSCAPGPLRRSGCCPGHSLALGRR